MDTKEVIRQELQTRMARIEALNNQARDLLEKGDFLQSAVRLQKLAEQGQFDNLLLNIFDSMSATDVR